MTSKSAQDPQPDDTVKAGVTKRFFVEMLTRDIELEAAILDLLDNCVDGILRSTNRRVNSAKPYEGFWAHIEFNEQRFKIEDNCGGIPLDLAKEHAFMMGRPRYEDNSNKPTVGMYGIGMKRAIFKMGRKSRVVSRTSAESFEVTISPQWLSDDTDWNLPLYFIPPAKEDGKTVVGTTVEVEMLRDDIKKIFSSTGSPFEQNFTTIVAQYYSFIIRKGFTVKVNGNEIIPKPLKIISSDLKPESRRKALTPYMYNGTRDGVHVRLVVGLNSPIPEPDEVEEEQDARRKTEDAGWTVICNDRVVVYNDKSRITGWGEADVPSYHTQFIGISGVVTFQSTDAWKLPVTSTKRDLDTSSDLYLYVKDFMREGLKKFTTYTYKWKTDPKGEKEISKNAPARPIEEFLKMAPSQAWAKVRGSESERKFNLELPVPNQNNPNKQVRFFRPESEIKRVSEHLFGNPDVPPKEVGEECFSRTLERAKKK